MDKLAISFASLVKSNGGLFKSEKQAKFLLSQCINNVFYVAHCAYGNQSGTNYICDNLGVLQVVKENTVKGALKLTCVWDRINPEVQETIANKKALKHAKKIAKIEARETAYNNVREYLNNHTSHYEAIRVCIVTRMPEGLEPQARAILAPIFSKMTLTDIAKSGNPEFSGLAQKLINRESRLHEKACNLFYS